MKLLPKMTRNAAGQRRYKAYNDLIRHEAKIGGNMFGPIPAGHQREFFCLDEHAWVWHEQWTDAQGKVQAITTRYEVRPDGVLKIQNDQLYQSLTSEEATNLYKAVELYSQRVLPLYTQPYFV